VLGLAAAYGLAWFGLWPTAPAEAPPADPRLASFATAIPELETVTQTTQAELATLNQRIGALETAEPAAAATTAEPVDLSTIEADIAALTQRIDSVSAPPADTGVDALRAELAALNARLAELAARLGTAEAGLRDLDTTVTETSATLASQPSDIGAVLQLPLILSGFETAFATGRPFETELSALRAAVPDAAIPTAIANNAATGLTRPDIIASRFAEVLPAMLAGRPVDATEQWQDGALDWFRSAIALRPTGEIEGDNPEAVMSRLEGAIARRDFTTAETLLASLPEPMLSAAGDVPALVASQAEAARFLDTLRASALSGEAMQ
ncbi:MAG: COG4223 family protein, partial [Devosia sp.]